MSLLVERVTKRYGRGRRAVTALDGLSLSVEHGELLVVVGPSGAGKSSLLRLVAGIERVDAGRVLVDGHDVTFEPPGARGVAMVFQDLALYPHLTVAQNLAFDLGSGARREDGRETITATLDRFDVREIADRRPAELSGGERQRVALARALVRRPGLLLLDEPFSTADAEHRHAFRREVQRHQRELGVTTLHVTHDSAEAMDLGDRIAVLDDGQVVQVGTPGALWRDPDTVTVARRFGEEPVNELVQADGSRIAVRPEHVLGVEGDSPPTDGTVELGRGVVAHRADLGDRIRTTVRMAPDEVRSTHATVGAIVAGAPVVLCARAEHVLRFDGAGRRIR
jgi:ABC-type sugar transport system ATPase subunit